MRLGFIGLGAMGELMAGNLIAAGYSVTVWNRSAEPGRRLVDKGAVLARSPKEVAENAEITIAMLLDEAVTDGVLEGESGWLAGGQGGLLINMATVRPAYNESLAKRMTDHGLGFLEAPVMGSTGAARTGELVVLAGGDEVLLGRCAPVLDILGKKTVHCGEAGKASSIKLAINLYLGLTMTGLTEAVNLARSLGASTELLIGCLQAGPLNSGLIAMKKDALLKGDYTPAFSSANMAKDLNYAVEVAAANDALTPMGEKARDLYEQILAQGLGDKDLSAIGALYRQPQGA